MPLTLYNTLTRRKEPFEPLDPSNVRLYVCGPTVYDFAHIGNARAVVAFDLLYRVLRHEYGAEHVRYVRNITDVEDKIIAAAREGGEPIDALTRRTTAIFHEDMAALGNLMPDIEPRATENIPQMIAMIERLIASGHAYAAEGHVLFRVASYPGYGALSRRSRADLIAGARVEIAPYKEDPGDFVLWKPSTPDQPGWDSPWGRGRPGWHIECSAMCESAFGETFDIHGGGLDLVFPHHENEIAQSVCAHEGRPFARYWLHNGMLTVGGAKMAKSEGNFITVRDALGEPTEWPRKGEILRLALLRTHYRDPLDWSDERLREARQILDGCYRALELPQTGGASVQASNCDSSELFHRALDDDLNTHLAVSQMQAIVSEINTTKGGESRATLQNSLKECGELLGLLVQPPENWFRPPSVVVRPSWFVSEDTFYQPTITQGPPKERIDKEHIDKRIALRAKARHERRFADADRIRAELAANGIILEDKPDGTTEWRRG